MLKIQEPQTFIGSLDLPAPNVYIHSTDVYMDKFVVHYSIEDDVKNWVVNDQVLDNIFLFISFNDQIHKESLSSIKKRSKIIDGKVFASTEVLLSTYNLDIKAYCGNDKVKGNEVYEKVLLNNSIVTSSYNNELQFKYINKNKDLRLLEGNFIDITKSSDLSPQYISELFVSYTTNKNSNFGFVFNVENFLINHSKTYNSIKSNKELKQYVLSGSNIDPNSIKFFKLGIDDLNEDYASINTSVKVIKTSDSYDNSDYIITSNDDNLDIFSNNRYKIKVSMNVRDNSSDIISQKVLSGLLKAKSFTESYKNIFELIEQNDKIKDKQTYIFENVYEKHIDTVKETIQTLGWVFSVYMNKNIDQLYSLFTNIYHPLCGTVELFDICINKINLLERFVRNILNSNNPTGVVTLETDNKVIELKHEFKFIDIDSRQEYQTIDYDYKYRHGYEVITMDSSEVRYGESANGLKVLTIADKNARKIYESNKYFGTSDPNVYNKINHLSISFIDLGEDSYDLLTNIADESPNEYNDIFVRLNELNNYDFKYNNLESYYFQLLGQDVYVKSVGTRNNGSLNSLQKTTIFDPNLDSKQKSLKFLSDTGINVLYYILDQNKFNKIPPNIYQYNAAYPNGQNAASVFPISGSYLNNPEAKPKLISYYNTFFQDSLIYSGQNYEIWKLDESLLNDLYKKKLKLFNEYYILEKKKTIVTPVQEFISYPFDNELKYNIPTKYLNRNINTYKVLISTEEI